MGADGVGKPASESFWCGISAPRTESMSKDDEQVAVCCGVLRCVALCCSVLPCAAVCCSVKVSSRMPSNALHGVALCCNVLWCVVV